MGHSVQCIQSLLSYVVQTRVSPLERHFLSLLSLLLEHAVYGMYGSVCKALAYFFFNK